MKSLWRRKRFTELHPFQPPPFPPLPWTGQHSGIYQGIKSAYTKTCVHETFMHVKFDNMYTKCNLLFKYHVYWKNIRYRYTECPRRNVRDFGRVFLMLNYSDITQNTYIQSWTVTEIMAREVWNFDSCYSLIDYQIHIETGRNMRFCNVNICT